MKKVLSLLFVILFFFTISLEAETKAAEKEHKHGIGAAAGFVTGYGLSYRYYGNILGIQLTLAPYVSENTTITSSGVALLKTAYQGKRSSLFIYNGYHYIYARFNQYMDEDEEWYTGDWTTEHRLNVGAGPGFKFYITENITFDLMAGYAVYMMQGESTSLNFTGETALFFNF